jgi:hypothetical protein
MKQLLTILLLTLATTGKAQDTLKIPVPAARQIAKDLTICDSLKSVHELIKKQLILTEDKVVLKDSVIDSYKVKCIMYDTMLVNEQKKFEVQGRWVEDLRKENKKLRVKLLYTKISMSAAIAFLGYLLLK